MKTLKNFFENHTSIPAAFARKIWKAGRVSWADFKSCPNDYHAADTGAVGGMIYYRETVPFGKRHQAEITALVHELESEIGEPLSNKPNIFEDGETQYFNWLAWFAWETLAGKLINYLEN